RPRRSGCRASRGSGARGRRRSTTRSLERDLGAVEVGVLLCEWKLGERLPVLGRISLRALDALDEPARHGPQPQFGIDVQPPRYVDRGEEDIPQLLEHAGMRLGLGISLAELGHRLLQPAQL